MRDELIKKLKRAYLLAWASCGEDRPLADVADHERADAGIRAVFAELIKTDLAKCMPLVSDCKKFLIEKGCPPAIAVKVSLMLHTFIESSVAPVVAAQRARIAELEAGVKQQQTNRDNWLNHVREQLGIPNSLGIVDFGKDQAKRIAALELFMAADQPWSTVSAIERLIEGADHLLNDHDCDHEGYESLIAARDALRKQLDERRI